MTMLFPILFDTFLDTLEIFPLLLLVYVLLELLEHRLDFSAQAHLLTGPAGPLLGAVVGCIPQCGFSAAAATLFNYKRISGGALVAVFLATSDEAIPVLLAHPDQFSTVIGLMLCKIIIALFWGYCFWAVTWLRYRHINKPQPILLTEECHHEKRNVFLSGTYCSTRYISQCICSSPCFSSISSPACWEKNASAHCYYLTAYGSHCWLLW